MMDIRKAVPTNGGDWLTKFGEIWKAQTAQIQENLGGDRGSQDTGISNGRPYHLC